MTFTVSRLSKSMVQPSESTPSGTLNLSLSDKAMIGTNQRILHVFRHGHEEAGKIVREALSKALVPYYPLAGRLKESSEGEVQNDCTGEGVWFVHASSNCTLESVNYFDDVPILATDELFPPTPPDVYGVDPLLQIQITSFSCQGFTMGLVFSHTVLDGLGCAQFLNAVGEFARGFPHPKIVPVSQREAVFPPARINRSLEDPKVLPLQQLSMPSYQLEYACKDFSLYQINKLKKEFFESTGKRCSTFDVVAASIWRQRTHAIQLEENTIVKLVFTVNTRKFLDPPLPEGFYGNCIFPAIVSTTSGWLVKASNEEIVKLIKDSKDKVPYEFSKWMNSNDQLDNIADPFEFSLSYTTLYLSDWRHLGFNQVDYGWGCPVYVCPVEGSIITSGILGLPPKPASDGTRIMTWCVTKEHLGAFINPENI